MNLQYKPEILFEDNHLLVVHKPANMPVQADSSNDPDLQNVLKTYLIEKYNKPGDAFLGIVHRLDRPTTGIMLFAKTSKAASRLSDQFRRRNIKKTYWAVVEGEPPLRGSLNDYLWKNKDSNVVLVKDKNQPQAKSAILSYKNMGFKDGLSLLEIELETGRSHQIRVQFSNAGFPLWGDYKYGSTKQPQNRILALLACQIGFNHPTQKNFMQFTTKLPTEYPWNLFELT